MGRARQKKWGSSEETDMNWVKTYRKVNVLHTCLQESFLLNIKGLNFQHGDIKVCF